MAKRQKPVKDLSTLDVFAAACAAQRINGEYLRSPQIVYNEQTHQSETVREANKHLMGQLLHDSTKFGMITDADRTQAETIRTYFQCKLMDVLANTASEFTKMTVSLASQEEIKSNNFYAMAVIASLPTRYERSSKREDAQLLSQHFGQIGDRISGEFDIIDCHYSNNWNTWYINAAFNNNIVLFAYKNELEKKRYSFSGTVKSHRDNNVTQLNRVRVHD